MGVTLTLGVWGAYSEATLHPSFIRGVQSQPVQPRTFVSGVKSGAITGKRTLEWDHLSPLGICGVGPRLTLRGEGARCKAILVILSEACNELHPRPRASHLTPSGLWGRGKSKNRTNPPPPQVWCGVRPPSPSGSHTLSQGSQCRLGHTLTVREREARSDIVSWFLLLLHLVHLN